MPRPPLRAVMMIAAGWIGLRVWLLWPGNQAEVAVAHEVAQVVQSLPPLLVEPTIAPPPLIAKRSRPRPILAAARMLVPPPVPRTPIARPIEIAATPKASTNPFPSLPPPQPNSVPQLAVPPRSRWSGWAYGFARPGSGRTLAAGGQLGGSQVAARVAYRLTDRLSLAARAYAPLGGKGAEASIGADVPIGPVHAIVERRIGIDRQGRNAWSAYATTGAYREFGPLVIDGYAQAGMVGARRHDGFVDGAVRAGARLYARGPIVGAGVWGAAQPGVTRIDAGPRVAWTLPKVALTAAIEGRFRVAGNARPGSGVAFTIARDF